VESELEEAEIFSQRRNEVLAPGQLQFVLPIQVSKGYLSSEKIFCIVKKP
jgi:hypothetical protein